MCGRETSKRISSNWFFVLVSLLTLVTFVVAQSVYEVLSSNQDFLAVRQVGNLQLLQIVLVFNLLPALALFLLWTLCRRLHRSLARLFLAAVYLVFFLAFFLQIHNAYLSDWQPFPHAYLLWTGPAALLGFISLRFEKSFRSFLLALAPAVLIFPALFLHRTWTNPTSLLPEGDPVFQQEAPETEKGNFPPIFFLVFDELTLHALLDDNGQIDGTRFPNFKKLADESYWFRNTTANADYTHNSIPIILTGNYPHDGGPSNENYPNNLFSLLYPYYDIHIHEFMTHFCVPRLFHCPDVEFAGGQLGLLRDVFYLYAARIAPKGIDVGLPDLTRTWGPFRTREAEITAHIDRFEKFLDTLNSNSHRRPFHFMHNWLPHAPYILTSEGRIHEIFPNLFHEHFRGNFALLSDMRARYLMQVGYVDRQLGEFVTRLKQVGLYNKALILVTSDHGVSWKPEAPGRELSRANADMILPVPLFIKVPLQEAGVISDRDVQLIDIVPTIADFLGLRIPWEHVGRSVFGTDAGARPVIAYSSKGAQYEFPSNLALARVKVKLEGQPGASTSPLIGQVIGAFELDSDRRIGGGMDTAPEVSSVPLRPNGSDYAIYVHGWAAFLDPPAVPEQIAVALNGKIVTVTSPGFPRPDVVKHFQNPKLLRSGWVASFSSGQLREGANVVMAYVVVDAKTKKLASLSAATGNVIHRTPAGIHKTSPLVGKKIRAFEVKSYKAVKGTLDSLSDSRLRLKSDVGNVPITVHGWAALVDQSNIPDEIAIAVNGEIVTVTAPCCTRPDVAKYFKNPDLLQSGWVATFSSRKLKEGENTVTAYVVLDAKKKQLAILSSKNKIIEVVRP